MTALDPKPIPPPRFLTGVQTMTRTLRYTIISLSTVALVLTTNWVTRTLFGQHLRQKTATPVKSALVGETKVTPENEVVPIEPLAKGQANQNLLRGMDFPKMLVIVNGGLVNVEASAIVHDKVPGNSYVWSIRVYQSQGKKELVREHHYTEFTRHLEEGETTGNPTFQDSLRLPPGNYMVELSLYATAPDFDFQRLKPNQNIKALALTRVSRTRKIVIH